MYTSVSHRSRLALVLLQSVLIELPCDISLHISRAPYSMHISHAPCSMMASSSLSVNAISSLGGEWSAEGCTMVSVLESGVVPSHVASSVLLLLALSFPLIHCISKKS